MDNEIVLRGVESDLVLEVVADQYGWTRCYLVKGQQRIYLGAETISILVMRLLQGLNEQLFSAEIDLEGEKVHWVLSLSERHHVLYATLRRPEQKLFWQDTDGKAVKIVSVITLLPEQRKKWLEQLGSLKDRWSQIPQWNGQ